MQDGTDNEGMSYEATRESWYQKSILVDLLWTCSSGLLYPHWECHFGGYQDHELSPFLHMDKLLGYWGIAYRLSKHGYTSSDHLFLLPQLEVAVFGAYGPCKPCFLPWTIAPHIL